MQNNQYNGIAEDTRTPEDKAKDFIHEELFSAPLVAVWTEREPRKFPIKNQDGSGACVAFATAKILGIDEVYEGREYIELSPRDIYVRRANKDTMGMFLPNALEIARKHGCTLESLLPSEDKGETAMNSKDDITDATDLIALKYKSAGYVEIPVTMEAIGAITSMGKGVLLGHRFDYEEWLDTPIVIPTSKRSCGHGTAGVDNVLRDGKKYIVMDDSWGPHQAHFGQRHLSDDWIKNRVFYAGYTMNFIYNDNQIPKPKHTFTKWLKRGDKNSDVVALQDILKYEGMFPLNVESTGLYGPATQRGVKAFQQKYLKTNNGGKQAGPATVAKLNELYSL